MARHGENIRRRKDGRWEARYIDTYDNNGRAKYRSVYGHSYEEVRKKREQAQQSPADGKQKDMTFAQVFSMWLESKKDSIKPSTYNQYSNQCRMHLLPDLRNRKISSITAYELNTLLKQKEEDGYSRRTLLIIRTVLKMILLYAERNGISSSSFDDLYMPKKPLRTIEAFTVKEQKTISEYLFGSDDLYSLAVLISLYCGLRIGEVCALQWKDVDLRKETLTVSKTLIRIQNQDDEEKKKTEIIIQNPKSQTSSRIVPIPSFLVNKLEKTYPGDPAVFVITGTNKPMEPRQCLRKFKKLISELEVSDYSFHACRHTYATRCIELGIDAKILSEMLGHTSVKTTLDRYVHPSIDVKKQQVNKLKILTEEEKNE